MGLRGLTHSQSRHGGNGPSLLLGHGRIGLRGLGVGFRAFRIQGLGFRGALGGFGLRRRTVRPLRDSLYGVLEWVQTGFRAQGIKSCGLY